jgi:hypothetical protein
VHAALDDGVLDAEHFCDLGFHCLRLEKIESKLQVSLEMMLHGVSLTLRRACLCAALWYCALFCTGAGRLLCMRLNA